VALYSETIDNQTFTWFARLDNEAGGLFDPAQAQPTGDMLSGAGLREIVTRREALPRDEESAQSILSIPNGRSLQDRAVQRLETHFLRTLYEGYANAGGNNAYDPLSPVVTLTVNLAHQASQWLFGFYRQTQLKQQSPPASFSPPARICSYTVSAGEFGETLHIFGVRELLRGYRPPGGGTANKPELGWNQQGGSPDAVTRFISLLGSATSPVSGPFQSTQRGDINRYLLAPLLVKDPLSAHRTILEGLLPRGYAAIAAAVDAQVAAQVPSGRTLPGESVGIWIRDSQSNATTNTTADRFSQIVGEVPAGNGIMLLGDRSPTLDAAINNVRSRRMVIDMRGLGDAAWLLTAQGTGNVVLYQSQAAALVRLYRHHGLCCLVGNKSGGMDLAAFASIPSIQFSPDAVSASAPRLLQRLVFTSLCSPFWRILNIPPGQSVAGTPLANAIAAASDTKSRQKPPAA
jgi:hypothetical protein